MRSCRHFIKNAVINQLIETLGIKALPAKQ